MNADRKTCFEELKAAGLLPSPQGVAVAILEATQSPNADIHDVTRLVQVDPALAGRLLRYANAARGGSLRPIVSVHHAIVFLGLFRVRQIVLGFSLLDQYRSGKCEAFDYSGYWAASLATAVAAQKLAPAAQSPPDETFACGLLSGIGRLGLATAFPQSYSRILAQADSPQALIEAEIAEFGTNHAGLSAEMLASWGLPEIFANAVRYHEDLAAVPVAPVTRQFALTAVLHCAMQIARVLNLDGPERWDLIPALYGAAAQVGTEKDDLPSLLESVATTWREWTKELTLPNKHYLDVRELLAAPPSTPAQGVGLAQALPHLSLALLAASRELQPKFEQFSRMSGIPSREFASIRDLLACVGRECPNVLILELGATVAEAVSRLQSVRADVGPGLPILILIPQQIESAVAELLFAGATDYLRTEFSEAALVARLSNIQRLLSLQDTVRSERELVVSASGSWARANRRLLHEALTDALTQLPNRRYGMDRLEQEWAIAHSNSLPIACLMLDVDHFKRVNDQYGHEIGDRVLRQVAATIENCSRRTDIVFRYGGEEFCVVCPGTHLREAIALAARIATAVRHARFDAEDMQFPVTVSIGVADSRHGAGSADELIVMADKALYAAKNSGRNCVRAAGD